MSTPEQNASARVRAKASDLGMRLFRNNSGAFKDETGRLVRFGLGNESLRLNKKLKFGDYVGITPVTITPDMVGKTIGVFTNIEVKPEGKIDTTMRRATTVHDSREAAQLRAIQFVRQFGGIAWFATSGNDVEIILQNYMEHLTNES